MPLLSGRRGEEEEMGQRPQGWLVWRQIGNSVSGSAIAHAKTSDQVRVPGRLTHRPLEPSPVKRQRTANEWRSLAPFFFYSSFF